MKRYVVTTMCGERYDCNESGQILAFSNGYKSVGSDSWKLLGFREIRAFNRLGPLIPLADAALIKVLHFKNGKPRYTLQDFDHGTQRVIGNWEHHGVRGIYTEEDGRG